MVKIQEMSKDGTGVAKIDGMAVFVSGAVTGDECEIKITKQKKNFACAEAVKIIKPSPFRTKFLCAAEKKCGGCAMAELLYERQLEEKKNIVTAAMRRIGGFASFEPEMTIGAKNPLEYRNKAVFHMKDSAFGFYESRTHETVPVKRCFLVPESFSIIAAAAAKAADGRIFIRSGFSSGEIVAAVSGKIKGDVRTEILKAYPPVTGITVNEKTVSGSALVHDVIMGVEFEISPESFFQVNPEMTRQLYKSVIEFSQLDKCSKVLDIYCGIGTISLIAARTAGSVIGVEIVPQAVENARRNAKINGISNATFYADSAAAVVPRLVGAGERPDVVILDPPRRGSDAETLNAIIEAAPKRIVYVSCDPATLARDAKHLCAGGYTLDHARIFDMFPMTMHVETVVLMSRVNE